MGKKASILTKEYTKYNGMQIRTSATQQFDPLTHYGLETMY